MLSHAALKWFHSFFPRNDNNPLDSSVYHNLLEAAKRCKPVIVKMASMPADVIRSIVNKYAGPSVNLEDLRLACIYSLGFAGFFRPEYLRVFVPRAKNDIYREGNHLYVKRLGNNYCPVALSESYILLEDINLSSSVALFRPVRLFKSTNEHKLYGGKLSYSRCREIFKDCLKELGLDHKMYGLHSLRSGGATSAVSNNPNPSERLLN